MGLGRLMGCGSAWFVFRVLWFSLQGAGYLVVGVLFPRWAVVPCGRGFVDS